MDFTPLLFFPPHYVSPSKRGRLVRVLSARGRPHGRVGFSEFLWESQYDLNCRFYELFLLRCPTSSSAFKSLPHLSTAATRSGRSSRHWRRSHRSPYFTNYAVSICKQGKIIPQDLLFGSKNKKSKQNCFDFSQYVSVGLSSSSTIGTWIFSPSRSARIVRYSHGRRGLTGELSTCCA